MAGSLPYLRTLGNHDYGKRLLHVVSKHRSDMALIESALATAGVPDKHRIDLQAHLDWLRGGATRTLPRRVWRYVTIFARPSCSIPGCDGKGFYTTAHSNRSYCRKHRSHTQGDRDSERSFRGYNDRSDSIAASKYDRDNFALNRGIGTNSGTIQRVRRG